MNAKCVFPWSVHVNHDHCSVVIVRRPRSDVQHFAGPARKQSEGDGHKRELSKCSAKRGTHSHATRICLIP